MNIKTFLTYILVIFLLLSTRPLYSQTHISGIISGVLHQEDSPFIVDSTLEVPAGDSLIIEPGVELRFKRVKVDSIYTPAGWIYTYIWLEVYGTIIAEGTETDSIRFIADEDPPPGFASYMGIKIENSIIDTNRFSYIHMNHSYHGILTYFSKLVVENSSFIEGFGRVDGRDSSIVFVWNNEGSGGKCNGCLYFESIGNINIAGIIVRCTQYAIILDNTYMGEGTGIHDGGGNGTLIIKGNTIKNIGTGEFEYTGINLYQYEEDDSLLVTENIITGAYYRGIYMYGGGATISKNIITIDIEDDWGEMGISDPTIETVIVNNNLVDNYTGIYIMENNFPTIKNNIFYENGYNIYCAYTTTPGTTSSYNDYYPAGSGCFIQGEGDISENPLFVDWQNGDYHLQANSPCIDAGDPNSPLDPDSTRADMGALFYDQSVSIDDEKVSFLPTGFRLYQNTPNPFNSQTTIKYELAVVSNVSLLIYNILGDVVKSFEKDQRKVPGLYKLVWDGRDERGIPVGSGVYLLKLQTTDPAVSGSYGSSGNILTDQFFGTKIIKLLLIK